MPERPSPTDHALTPDEVAAKAARRRRRRRRRAARAVVLGLLLVVLGAWFLLTRSPLTGAIVLPKLEAALGAKIEAEAVVIGLDGSVILKRARFMAPGVPGPAGEIFSVTRVDAAAGWRSLLSGRPSIRELTLVEPVLRVSQSTEDQSVNLAKLHPPASGGPASEIPTITVERGAIELGEHTGVAYTPLKRIGINGRLRPTLEAGAYVIDLRQMGEGAGFDLRGVLSPKEVSLTLRGLTLDDWKPESVPTPVRGIFSLLDMKGEIAETSFDYEFGGGMRAGIVLKDVALNLPVSEGGAVADPASPAPAALMRMQQVNGVVEFDGTGVRARGAGLLEDLPYQLDLAYTGLSVNSPFTCRLVSREFQINENPQIVRFTPPVVRERLANFSNPTGIVNTEVRFARGEPVDGKPGPVRVDGRLNFREATAAFHKFPYRFHNLSGSVRFDEDRIDILEVRGTAPSGARISAHGEIYPPNSDSYVNVKVHVDDVPIDETLKEAMGPGRRRILDVIFNQEKYAELLSEGLIRPPGSPPGPAPEFAMGGRASIDVTVIRDAGPGSNWHEEIDVKLPHASLVPEPFPLPILADDVAISVRDDVARVVGGSYRGLRGGAATVEATTSLAKLKTPDAEIVPSVRITARDVPVDDLLVRATPGPRPGDGPDALSAREVLRQLHVEGVVNCEARIDAREDGRLGYDIEVEVPGVIARARSSAAAAEPFIMEDARGRIHVSEARLQMDLQARAPGPASDATAGVQGRGEVALNPEETGDDSIAINVRCDNLDLAAPIEEIVGIFSSQTAQRVLTLRQDHRPEGRVDASVQVSRPPAVNTGEPGPAPQPVVQVELTGGRDLALDAAGGRIGLPRAAGLARLIADHHPRAVFEGFGGPVTINGQPCGTASAAGWLDLPGMGEKDGESVSGGELRVELREALFESPATAWAARERIGGGLRDVYDEAQPTGVYDADLLITPARAGDGWDARGSISPRRLSFRRNGEQVSFTGMSGHLEFERNSGKLVGLSGAAAKWSWAADGSWVMESTGRPALKTSLRVESAGLPPDLKAVLPRPVVSALEEISFDLDGAVRAPAITLKWTPGEAETGDWVSAAGQVQVQEARLEAGLPVADATGVIDFAVERAPGTPARYEFAGLMNSFSLAGVQMTGGRVKVVGGESADEILIPLVSADCHRGRMTGRARVQPSGDRRRYEADFSLAGVQFGAVLADLAEYSRQTAPEAPEAAAQVAGSPDEAPRPDPGQRGLLDARLSLAGIIGDDASRRGRGEGRVYGGRVVNYPLLMRLIRVSNLQLPLNDTVELARASFYVEKDTITFEDVSVSSGSIEILGFGTMTWPGLEADMQFNSRSVRRVPVLSDVLETVRDELITTRVTGKVSDPAVETVGFRGTRKFLSRIFGGGPSEQERRLAEIEARARRERERARSAGVEPARRGE